MRKKHYISDVSEEQFNKVKPLLESARKKTRPRQVDLYDVFCAILYFLNHDDVFQLVQFIARLTARTLYMAGIQYRATPPFGGL